MGTARLARKRFRLANAPSVGPKEWRAPAVLLAILAVVLYAGLWLVKGKPVGTAILAIPLLLLLSAPIFLRAARSEHRFDLAGLLAVGLLLRFLAAYYRFTHAADAITYQDAGSQLAVAYRKFDFGAPTGSPIPGTGGMKVIAGVVSVFTNSSMFASFLVFAWLGFLGCYCFYRAVVVALPDADHRRYARLVFLWPTLLFWPSSIGKDCWLLFTIGLASLGAARVLARRGGGYSLLVLGLLGGSIVRPHVSLMVMAAFAVALLIGRRPRRPGLRTPGALAKIVGIAVIVVVGGVLANNTAKLLHTSDLNESINAGLAANAARTTQGGSAFTPANPQNPIGYLESAVTIVARPFPNEAHGPEGIGTSFEAMLLACFALASWRRLATIPRRVRGQPFVTYALLFTLMFFYAFGTIGNFGILARQRSQLMPFLFVLLSLPKVPYVKPRGRGKGRAGRLARAKPGARGARAGHPALAPSPRDP